MKITRRAALGSMLGITAVGAASAVGIGAYCAARPTPATGSAAHRLMLAFDDPRSAAHVGRRYLHRHPHEHDPVRLVAYIEVALEGPADAVRCPATARAALARQNVADFRAGRVVWLDGWLMGRTEARVCALATLHRT